MTVHVIERCGNMNNEDCCYLLQHAYIIFYYYMFVFIVWKVFEEKYGYLIKCLPMIRLSKYEAGFEGLHHSLFFSVLLPRSLLSTFSTKNLPSHWSVLISFPLIPFIFYFIYYYQKEKEWQSQGKFSLTRKFWKMMWRDLLKF